MCRCLCIDLQWMFKHLSTLLLKWRPVNTLWSHVWCLLSLLTFVISGKLSVMSIKTIMRLCMWMEISMNYHMITASIPLLGFTKSYQIFCENIPNVKRNKCIVGHRRTAGVSMSKCTVYLEFKAVISRNGEMLKCCFRFQPQSMSFFQSPATLHRTHITHSSGPGKARCLALFSLSSWNGANDDNGDVTSLQYFNASASGNAVESQQLAAITKTDLASASSWGKAPEV